VLSSSLLRRFGYRQILVVNTVLIACMIACYSLIGPGASVWANRADHPGARLLQLAAVLEHEHDGLPRHRRRRRLDGQHLASTLQQMSLSFGLATASLIAIFYLASSRSPTTTPSRARCTTAS